MSRVFGCFVAFLALATLASLHANPVPPPGKKPRVEVVFCLDTTGSMGGLIEGAKAKIWAICNQIAGGKPTPDLRVGLVAYRDRGDAYVTKVFDLSDDLDAIHGELKKFQAAGGGDGPESVNQALHDSVHKIKWSTDKKTLKILFLVGDAPPHMDYADDVKYPETCKAAVEKNIIINTIQCGNDASATRYWREIALKSEGSYVAIPQAGGVTVVKTPFDARLSELNKDLARTVLVWGKRDVKAADGRKQLEVLTLPDSSAAERVAFQAKNAQASSYCLLDQIKSNKVKLEDVKKEELPAEMQKMTLREQKDYLDKIAKQRAELNKQVLELDRKRSDYIAKERAEATAKGTSGFDGEVLDILRRQAKKHDIGY